MRDSTTQSEQQIEGDIFSARLDQVRTDEHIIGKPFYFKGENGKAVLLIHGWSSTPYEMRALGERLHSEGYSVYAPLLTGHGTVPEDLEGVTWKHWRQDAFDAYETLRATHDKVFVGGMSAGGSLSLMIAQHYDDVDGLILMATPYKLRYEYIGSLLTRAMMLVRSYKQKSYPKVFASMRGMSQIISYQRYPYTSAFQALYAIRNALPDLHKVTKPCMIIQSRADHLITPRSADKFELKMRSPLVQKRFLDNAYHNFVADVEHSYIFDEILDFLHVSQSQETILNKT